MGKVVGNPGMTGKRRSSFDVEVFLVRDKLDRYSSAKGHLHVVSREEELYSGDTAVIEGELLDGALFIADKVHVRKHGYLYSLKRRSLSFIRGRLHGLPEEERELALRLVLASGDEASYEISELAREKGVSHVFALSGMHLELIFTFSSFMLIFIRSDRARDRLTLFPLLLFSFLSSFGASLLRALLMRGIRAIFPSVRSDENLCYAFMLHAFLSPHMIMTAGGILSYVSIASILFISEHTDKMNSLLDGVLITSGCLLSTGFYTDKVFSSFTLSGLVYSPMVSYVVRLYMMLLLLFIILPFPFIPWVLGKLYRLLLFMLTMPGITMDKPFSSSYILIATVFTLLFSLGCGKKKGFTVSFLHCVETELRKHK